MEASIAISLCVVIVLTAILCFILGHRVSAAQMERMNKQHAEMLAATVYLLANGVQILPDEDAPTDESAPPKPNLLLFKRGEEKGANDTPPKKE